MVNLIPMTTPVNIAMTTVLFNMADHLGNHSLDLAFIIATSVEKVICKKNLQETYR